MITKEGIDMQTKLFSDKAIYQLIIPLIVEQVLAVTVGMADIMMISVAGEAAVSVAGPVFAGLAKASALGSVCSGRYCGSGSKSSLYSAVMPQK